MDWSTVVSTLVGAFVALAGSFLASKLSADQSRRDWLRGKRAESYEKFFRLLQEIRMDATLQEVLHTSYGAGEPTPVPRASPEQLRERSQLLMDTSHLVQFYASPKLALSAPTVSVRYALLVAAILQSLSDAEREKQYSAFQEALAEAEADLRNDLDVRVQRRPARLRRSNLEWPRPD